MLRNASAVLVFLSISVAGFAQGATNATETKIFDCQNAAQTVQVRLALRSDTTGSFFITGLLSGPRTEEVHADPHSSPTNYVFVDKGADLEQTQRSHNSITVFIINRAAVEKGSDTKAQFEDRDYDDDYDHQDYLGFEKGPLADEYVLRNVGTTFLDCHFVGIFLP